MMPFSSPGSSSTTSIFLEMLGVPSGGPVRVMASLLRPVGWPLNDRQLGAASGRAPSPSASPLDPSSSSALSSREEQPGPDRIDSADLVVNQPRGQCHLAHHRLGQVRPERRSLL